MLGERGGFFMQKRGFNTISHYKNTDGFRRGGWGGSFAHFILFHLESFRKKNKLYAGELWLAFVEILGRKDHWPFDHQRQRGIVSKVSAKLTSTSHLPAILHPDTRTLLLF